MPVQRHQLRRLHWQDNHPQHCHGIIRRSKLGIFSQNHKFMETTIFFQILRTGVIDLPASITDLLGLPEGEMIVLPKSVVIDTGDLISGVKNCSSGIGDCKDDLFLEVCVCLPFVLRSRHLLERSVMIWCSNNHSKHTFVGDIQEGFGAETHTIFKAFSSLRRLLTHYENMFFSDASEWYFVRGARVQHFEGTEASI